MIDAHMHLGSLPFKGKNWGNQEEYKLILKETGITKYCATPIGLPENFSHNTTPNNNSVLEESEKDSALIPIYWFNVFDIPDKIDSRYKAIKFHPDIGQIPIDDKKVIEFVNKINFPVFIHTNEAKEYSTLKKIISLAKQVEVPVIAVHSGSVTKTFFKLHDYEFPDNVYFETSGIQYSIILKKIYEMVGAEKIILGSDYPFGDPRVSLAMIDSLNISPKEKELITTKNIEKILKI
ncbi:amidohydrolase family protein [Candidatus Pacearchaeota archaeon]|nr:amidohydrolase family protein [Candidatus Pacearchaeota archaeon]